MEGLNLMKMSPIKVSYWTSFHKMLHIMTIYGGTDFSFYSSIRAIENYVYNTLKFFDGGEKFPFTTCEAKRYN